MKRTPLQTARSVSQLLRRHSDPLRAILSGRYFKTGPGQYAEGDRFIGVTVPRQRLVAAKYRQLPLAEIKRLITSKIHEERLTALLVLVYQYENGTPEERNTIYKFYLQHTHHINNWDLVDTSAPYIIGPWLEHDPEAQSKLQKLAASKLIWERRIAVLATFYFIKAGQYRISLELAEQLLSDPHDLIHKAVGWMLREIGKRDVTTLRQFLATHYRRMPRIMLRYAIEHFEAAERQRYLKGQL
jgi:3-methyladenine DNA glycosylase AlkD